MFSKQKMFSSAWLLPTVIFILMLIFVALIITTWRNYDAKVQRLEKEIRSSTEIAVDVAN